MGRLSAPLLVLSLAALTALGLSACGSGGDADLLPGRTASEINANLDQVQELVGEGECIGAANAAEAVRTQIDALGGVDKKLKQALREGATRLNEVVTTCQEAEEEEPAIEEAVEPEEEVEEKEKPEKPDKKSKPAQEAEEEAPAETTPALPPQAEGKAKGHEKAEEEESPEENEGGGTPSGGVGPGAAVEGE